MHRDLAIVISETVSADAISSLVRENAGEFLSELRIFDVYQGKGIEEEKKSIAISVSWQSAKQTLKDSDIDSAVERIVNSMKKELGGVLRV